MKASRITLLLVLMVMSTILANGCATTNDDNNVSSIPWDRPQQWEGSGALGGMQGPGGMGH
jgi:type IV pilus biogenesis protein CpaD/CtpE